MEQYIPGHTGKQIIKTKAKAYWIAKHNYFGKKMRVYGCRAETGDIHWHVTRMSKGRYYTNQRRDPKDDDRRDNVA